MEYSNFIEYKQKHTCSCEHCREHIFVYRDHNGDVIKEVVKLVCYGMREMPECIYGGNKHQCRIL